MRFDIKHENTEGGIRRKQGGGYSLNIYILSMHTKTNPICIYKRKEGKYEK